MRKIKYIVLHCTAGSQRQTAKDVVYYHTGPKAKGCLGWRAPGYHYIVEPDGLVVNTWPEEKISNGVKGHNSECINISWIGGYGSVDNRTTAQKHALIRLVMKLKEKYPDAEVRGHRDFSDDKNGNGIIDPWERIKDCPCFDAITEYKCL